MSYLARVFVMFGWLGAVGVGFADIPTAKNQLQLAYDEFRDLATDMPWGHILFGREEMLRARYRAANRALGEALQSLEGEPKRGISLVKESLDKYRVLGLLMPFYSLDERNRDSVINRYLAAEDRLRAALKLLDGALEPPPSSTGGTWVHNERVWVALGKSSYSEAEERCRGLRLSRGAVWRVPTVEDLASSFRAMKNPASNLVFGAQARQFQEVWTSDPGTNRTVYFIHFQKEETGTAPPQTVYQTVCVGKPLSEGR